MKLRKTSRIVLLDARGRVLLFKIEDHRVFDPKTPVLKPYWITPGGEVEADQSHEDAVRRELWEETGISGIELGPWIWTNELQIIQANQSFSRR